MTLPTTPGSWSPEQLTEALGQVRSVVAVVGPRPAQERPLFRTLRHMAFSAALTVGGLTAAQQALPSLTVALGLGSTLASQPSQASVRSLDTIAGSLRSPSAWSLDPVMTLPEPVPVLSAHEQAWQHLMAQAPDDPHAWPGILHAEGEDFLALAAVMENFEPKPYMDPGGLNVGYGYCITQRIVDWGEERVREDLKEAGFDPGTIDTLLKDPRQSVKTITVNAEQALRLLSLTQDDYRTIARDTIEADVFDALPAHRQATLTWLAYNTGAEGFAQFRKLRQAVHDDAPAEASRHLMPYYQDGGEFVANRRAGAYLMAAFWSSDGLTRVIEEPNAVLETAQAGTSPVLLVDPKAQNAPPSPYPSLAQGLQQRQAAREQAQVATAPRPVSVRR